MEAVCPGDPGRTRSRRTTGVALNLAETTPAAERAAGAVPAVPTYPSWAGGREIDSGRYVYTVSTRALLDDVFAALTLKRRLEQGRGTPTGAVVGRCAVADRETVLAALDGAAAAAKEWAAVPLTTRMRLGAGIRERLRTHHAEFVELMVAEGSPRALAQWQVAGLAEVFSPETLRWCESQ